MPLVNVRVQHFVVDDAVIAFADAGEDQSVLCASFVQLQGEIIGDDPNNHTFEWEQTDGTPVTLVNPDTLFPTFLADPNQLSDYEFTLYVDRGTPFETSDTIVVSRRPTSTMIGGTSVGDVAPSETLSGGFFSASTASASDGLENIDLDFSVGAYSYNYPPDHTYSPIYKAEDLRRIKDNLAGKYWLMRDVDMADLDYPWDPLGTPQRPFSGELQGNGFNIDNLTISETPITKNSSDPDFGSVTFLVTAENSFDGAQSFTSDVGSATFNWENSLGAGSTRGEVRNDQAKFGSLSIWADGAVGPNFWGWTGPFNVEGGPFDLADQPFTLEAHVYLVTINSNLDILTVWDSQNTVYGFRWTIDSSTRMGMTVSTTGANIVTFASQQGAVSQMSLGQWYHVAITRSATGDVKCWLDGNQVGTTQTGKTQNIFTANTKLGLCCEMRNNSGNMGDTESYVDNVRITVGVDRYTSNFTAPAAPFSADLKKPAGLFSHIGNGATIEQVSLTNANISGIEGGLYKGILAGTAQGLGTDDGGTVTVRNVYVEGTIDSGGNQAGGLIGHTGANASSLYENTYSDVTVTGGGTSEGGWAGYFDTIATYNDNFWNSDKTTAGVGTDGDAAIAGELDALTTAQLQVQSNYTNWDFDTVWQMPELKDNIGPAQLQNDIFNRVANTGTCLSTGFQQGAMWSGVTSVVEAKNAFEKRKLLGVIIQDQNPATLGWENTRFIPEEQRSAIMTPGRRHRAFAVIDKSLDGRYSKFKNVKREITHEIPNTVVPKTATDSSVFAGATSSVIAPVSDATITRNLVIEITNPRKITNLTQDTVVIGGMNSISSPSSTLTVSRFEGASEFQTDTIVPGHTGSANSSVSLNLSVTRLSGAAIG